MSNIYQVMKKSDKPVEFNLMLAFFFFFLNAKQHSMRNGELIVVLGIFTRCEEHVWYQGSLCIAIIMLN